MRKRQFIKYPISNILEAYTMVDGNLCEVRDLLKARNVKEEYTGKYPTDTEGEYINPRATFHDLFNCLWKGNSLETDMGICDSIVRERCMAMLAEYCHTDYNVIYYLWLNA